MNDFYKLAFELNISFVIEPAWSEYCKLKEEANKLLHDANYYWQSGQSKTEDERIEIFHAFFDKRDRIWLDATLKYTNAVIECCGYNNARLNWKTGEVTKICE